MPTSAKSCANGCERHGTCNLLTGRCDCPLTRTGVACEQLTLPACAIDGEPLHPTFITNGWIKRLQRNTGWLAPLTCACLEQMVAMRHLLFFEDPYRGSALVEAVCALLPASGDGDQSVGALLAAPREANWTRVGIRLLANSPICTATQQPPVGGSWFGVVHGNLPLKMAHAAQRTPCSAAGAPAQWLAAAQRSQKAGTSRRKTIPEPPQADQLLPLSECPQRCGLRGVCVRRPSAVAGAHKRSHALCECLAPARRSGGGSCMMPRLPLPAAGPRRSYEEQCPGRCNGRGACDGEGFCRCEPGWWGLDCAITMSGGGPPSIELSDREKRRAAAGAAGQARGAHRLPVSVYVYDLPPLLRAGETSFESWFDFELSLQMLRHPLRAADPAAADFFWLMGPSSGAQLVDKLHWARQMYPAWNASVSRGEARHLAMLLSERGPGDVFDNMLLTTSPGLRAAPARAAAARHNHSKRNRRWLDPEISPASRTRAWVQLTHNGLADARTPRGEVAERCVNCFHVGKDIVLPFTPSTIDVPSCEDLRNWSVWSPTRGSRSTGDADRSAGREHLFFFGGRIHPSLEHARFLSYYDGPGSPHVRADILRLKGEPGFFIHNSFLPPPRMRKALGTKAKPAPRVSHLEMERHASFCWVPPGQRYGDARRHVPSSFLGCVPVFTMPESGGRTYDELIRWDDVSLDVPQSHLPRLPSLLRAVSSTRLDAMRQGLGCVWRRLWFSSIYGACLGEDPAEDAFDALLQVLARRARRWRVPPPGALPVAAPQRDYAACGQPSGGAHSWKGEGTPWPLPQAVWEL